MVNSTINLEFYELLSVEYSDANGTSFLSVLKLSLMYFQCKEMSCICNCHASMHTIYYVAMIFAFHLECYLDVPLYVGRTGTQIKTTLRVYLPRRS